ncbi:hypothetical protein B0H11DRAFT_2422334 [Mycena galericulata]|nr:hypothetical protein B0H11DRAFT_2422334 [Mycena galericulata]
MKVGAVWCLWGERPSRPIGTSRPAQRQRGRADRSRNARARPIPYTRATTGQTNETRSHPSVKKKKRDSGRVGSKKGAGTKEKTREEVFHSEDATWREKDEPMWLCRLASSPCLSSHQGRGSRVGRSALGRREQRWCSLLRQTSNVIASTARAEYEVGMKVGAVWCLWGERPSRPIGTSRPAQRQRGRADRSRNARARPIPYTRATTGQTNETRSHPKERSSESRRLVRGREKRARGPHTEQSDAKKKGRKIFDSYAIDKKKERGGA